MVLCGTKHSRPPSAQHLTTTLHDTRRRFDPVAQKIVVDTRDGLAVTKTTTRRWLGDNDELPFAMEDLDCAPGIWSPPSPATPTLSPSGPCAWRKAN
jgi:hypothetical protein